MRTNLFIGVDGGATKCTVRVEDEGGKLLGQATSGPANIRISTEQAWASIHSALKTILQPLGLDFKTNTRFHASMGLAGCELPEAFQAFIEVPHSFDTLLVAPDSHTACLGAHAGKDGSIIIIGTGVVGFQIEGKETAKIGGWGFPNDDEGGGAWLGLEAIKICLQWYDGRMPASPLASAIYQHFDRQVDKLVTWANLANSTAYATLAPLVIEQIKQADPVAIDLLKQGAKAIDKIGAALIAAQKNTQTPLPCALIGGLVAFIQPYLAPALQARLQHPAFCPASGALVLLRNHLKSGNT